MLVVGSAERDCPKTKNRDYWALRDKAGADQLICLTRRPRPGRVVTGSVALLHGRRPTRPLHLARKELVMDLSQPARPTPLPPSAASARSRNGLGVAALVIGVASLVAGVSFVLFPLALVGGLVGLILGIIALARGKNRGATNTGQAIADAVCCALALVSSIDLSVRVGTWAARNTDVFARFDKCIAQAANRADVSTCISRFANQVQP